MLTFPANPTVGQEVVTENVRFKFNGKIWARVSDPRLVGVSQITVGSTPPEAPTDGDIWFVTL